MSTDTLAPVFVSSMNVELVWQGSTSVDYQEINPSLLKIFPDFPYLKMPAVQRLFPADECKKETLEFGLFESGVTETPESASRLIHRVTMWHSLTMRQFLAFLLFFPDECSSVPVVGLGARVNSLDGPIVACVGLRREEVNLSPYGVVLPSRPCFVLNERAWPGHGCRFLAVKEVA